MNSLHTGLLALGILFALPCAITHAEEPAVSDAEGGGVKSLSGMSVLGNNEAPKSLVIVPWTSSELGDEPGVRNLLDERATPVDREVFIRELDYYAIRTGGTLYSAEK